jgi:hypothetical protein
MRRLMKNRIRNDDIGIYEQQVFERTRDGKRYQWSSIDHE